MHSVLGIHKAMTHQYTVNVQRGYTCIQGINSLYTTETLMYCLNNGYCLAYFKNKTNS